MDVGLVGAGILSGVLGAAPPDQALEVVEYAKAHGFRPRVLVIHDGDGQIVLDDEDRAVFKQIKAALGSGFGEARDYREKLLEEGEAPFKLVRGNMGTGL